MGWGGEEVVVKREFWSEGVCFEKTSFASARDEGWSRFTCEQFLSVGGERYTLHAIVVHFLMG